MGKNQINSREMNFILLENKLRIYKATGKLVESLNLAAGSTGGLIFIKL